MRGFFTFAALIAFLLAVDNFIFDGYYRHAAWQEAQYQGYKVRSEVDQFLTRALRQSGWDPIRSQRNPIAAMSNCPSVPGRISS